MHRANEPCQLVSNIKLHDTFLHLQNIKSKTSLVFELQYYSEK
jgi:hypothetical protein